MSFSPISGRYGEAKIIAVTGSATTVTFSDATLTGELPANKTTLCDVRMVGATVIVIPVTSW